ncbi:MAG: hypothetical protein U0L12_06755 [Ruminococcus sp.]|nr:hypothetical protein [Ruminococcus sp.]
MSKLFDNIQPAIKRETQRVAISTVIGVVLMWVVFFVFHMVIPEKIPFDYTVILGGIGGGIIAVLNFFLMGLTVQKVASTQDEDMARTQMKGSYSQRMLMQMIWCVIAIMAPCFQFVAGIVPLLFPSMGIKILGMMKK